MAYQFKSKTLQAIQAKREQQAREVVTGIAADFNRVKQKVEELYGERGQNSAIRRQELAGLTRVKIKTGGILVETTMEQRIAALQEDVENLYKLLAQIARKQQ